MNTTADQPTSSRALWMLLWRSMVYLPLALARLGLIVGFLVAAVELPILGAVSFAGHLPWAGVAIFATWLAMFWIWRRFRVLSWAEGRWSPF